jgi:hypothetical protein
MRLPVFVYDGLRVAMESFGAGTTYRSPIEPGACPHCGQRETVERVASLAAGGVTPLASTIGRVPIVLGTGRSYGMTPRNAAGVGISGLPAYLLPPPEPHRLRYSVTRHLVALAALTLIGVVPFLIGTTPPLTRATIGDSLPTLPFTVAGAALLIAALVYAGWGIAQLATGRARRHERDAIAAHTRATERWNNLYYCTDCHCVFAADTGQCIPHRQIPAYLSA